MAQIGARVVASVVEIGIGLMNMVYIHIETYSPEEIKDACADAFSRDYWQTRYDRLMRILRARRKTMLGSDRVIESTSTDGLV
jgi:hypothetical protein